MYGLFFVERILLVQLIKFELTELSLVSITGLGYFLKHKTQCPQIFIKLAPLEDNDSRKRTLKCYLLDAVVFEKLVKQCHENTFLHAKRILMTLFY